MQTIETKYHGPTNTRGSRISATASGCRKRVTVSYDHALNAENNHKAAALKLMEALNWTGQYVGGHTPTGMVFVHAQSSYVLSDHDANLTRILWLACGNIVEDA